MWVHSINGRLENYFILKVNFFLYFLKVKVSHSVMSNSLWPHGLYTPWNSPGQNLLVNWEKWKVKVLAAQLCLTLCDPVNCSLPGSSVHGILQVRVVEWVTIPFSTGSSQGLLNCRDWIQVSQIAGGFFTIWATRKPFLFLTNLEKLTYCMKREKF